MKHLAYFSIISLLVLFFVMLISISLIGSGTVVTSYEGFALDSNENLYLGVYGKINVYKDGSLLYSVDAHTLRAYVRKAVLEQLDDIFDNTDISLLLPDLIELHDVETVNFVKSSFEKLIDKLK